MDEMPTVRPSGLLLVVQVAKNAPLTQKQNKLSGSIIGVHKGIEPYFLRAAVRDKLAANPGSEASLDGWFGNFHSQGPSASGAPS